jgi:peptide-methionine (S)-S-oxide reductase
MNRRWSAPAAGRRGAFAPTAAAIGIFFLLGAVALGAASGASTPASPPAKTARATFAMGCFWCAETAFEGLPGVTSVISGFSGGTEKDPTYEKVSAGKTGYAESVDVTYDPAKITYQRLLDIFWHNIDPTQSNGQFCDHGKQYRSAIFYRGDNQRYLAEKSKKEIEASGRLKQPIVTEIVAFRSFTAAEEYHQDYYKKNPEHYHAYRTGCGRDKRLEQIWGAPGRSVE